MTSDELRRLLVAPGDRRRRPARPRTRGAPARDARQARREAFPRGLRPAPKDQDDHAGGSKAMTSDELRRLLVAPENRRRRPARPRTRGAPARDARRTPPPRRRPRRPRRPARPATGSGTAAPRRPTPSRSRRLPARSRHCPTRGPPRRAALLTHRELRSPQGSCSRSPQSSCSRSHFSSIPRCSGTRCSRRLSPRATPRCMM